jgi:ribonuclease HI
MVDSGASSNVMPLSVCQKINVEVKPSDIKIIHLDRTNVTVVGELKYVLIRLSSNLKVHQVIDIVIADIPEVYGMFLSRDWSQQLNGYFSTDWSHLWFPLNGQPNKLRINREHYLKYTVTDLNDPNEPFIPSENALENQGINTFFGNFAAEISYVADLNQQSEISVCTQVMTSNHVVNIVDNHVNDEIWSLYFDGSKSREGVGVSCLLIDPKGNKTFIACRLEFDCTNNIAEYEALLQGLKKSIDLDIQCLVVFDDSEIVVKQVKNTIHCVSSHLKNYQTEVWNLISKFLAFNISSIPRSSNSEADLLANVASKLFPAEGFSL